MQTKCQKLNLRMPLDSYQWLKDKAKEHGVSLNSYIVTLLLEYSCDGFDDLFTINAKGEPCPPEKT